MNYPKFSIIILNWNGLEDYKLTLPTEDVIRI